MSADTQLKNAKHSPLIIMAENWGSFDGTSPADPEANVWTKENYVLFGLDREFIKHKAINEGNNFKDILRRTINANILEIDVKNEPDGIFTADASQILVVNSRGEFGEEEKRTHIIFSKFGHTIRDDEVEIHRQAIYNAIVEGKIFGKDELSELGIDLSKTPQDKIFQTLIDNNRIIFAENTREGDGNNLYDGIRNVLWSAETGRSSPDSPAEIERKTGIKNIVLKLKPEFFHIDTAMYPLPDGRYVVCKEAFQTEKDYEFFIEKAFSNKELAEKMIIPISLEEAKDKFMGNAVVEGNNVLVPYEDQNVKELFKLKDKVEKILTPERMSFEEIERTDVYKNLRDFSKGNKKEHKERRNFDDVNNAFLNSEELKNYKNGKIKAEDFDEIYSLSLKQDAESLQSKYSAMGLQNISEEQVSEIIALVTKEHLACADRSQKLHEELNNKGVIKGLKDAGYHVKLVPMGASIMGGGGLHCTTKKHPQNLFVNMGLGEEEYQSSHAVGALPSSVVGSPEIKAVNPITVAPPL